MEIDLKNVGIIKDAHLVFNPGLNLIIGPSSSGKSTLLRAIRSMMDNSFTDANIAFDQKKMAIRIKEGENTATYIRDLENSNRKSAYQVNGQVYTKIGRNSLDALSSLFKIAPIEIDGEKINFNFSAQFSGPFLLLGSTSLLYSILTYRSTFDITKINDLYFTDYKKIKQDITVAQKTKEALEVEGVKLNKKYEMLSPITSVFNDLQKLKQDKSSFDSLLLLADKYKQIKKELSISIRQLDEINKILPKYDMLMSLNDKYVSVNKYIKFRDERKNLSVEDISHLSDSIQELKELYSKKETLSRYINMIKANKEYSLLVGKFNSLPDLNLLSFGYNYLSIRKDLIENKNEFKTKSEEYNVITEKINSVGICPLCKQPIS